MAEPVKKPPVPKDEQLKADTYEPLDPPRPKDPEGRTRMTLGGKVRK